MLSHIRGTRWYSTSTTAGMISDLREHCCQGTTQPRLPLKKKICQFGFEFAINILDDRGILDLPGQARKFIAITAQVRTYYTTSAWRDRETVPIERWLARSRMIGSA